MSEELVPCPICGEMHIDKSHGCVLEDLEKRVKQLEDDLYEEAVPSDEQSEETHEQQQFQEEPRGETSEEHQS